MSYKQPPWKERYQIYTTRKAGQSQKEIALTLSRKPSRLSMEFSQDRGWMIVSLSDKFGSEKPIN